MQALVDRNWREQGDQIQDHYDERPTIDPEHTDDSDKEERPFAGEGHRRRQAFVQGAPLDDDEFQYEARELNYTAEQLGLFSSSENRT